MAGTEKDKNNFCAISDYVYYYAKIQPYMEAMVLDDTRITYARMAAEVDKCAQALMASGVKKGDRVATLCPPSPDFFIIFLATSSIGAIWVGLNPKYTFEELCYVVLDAKPKIIFSRTEVMNRSYVLDLRDLKKKCSSLEQIITLGAVDETAVGSGYDQFLSCRFGVDVPALRDMQNSVDPKDTALLVYTSGTTGKPKGALLPHCGLIKCYEMQNRIYPCTSVRFVNFLPINHIGCVGDISCFTLVSGGTIIFLEQFDPGICLELMSDEKVTVWGGVPTTFLMCLSLAEFDKYDLSSLQLIFWSGAAAPKDLVVALSHIHPRLGNCYGQTETVGSITFVVPCNDFDLLTNTVGKPPEEYDVRIVDKNGDPVTLGQTGEIIVKGDFIMNGYWGRPEETAKAIDGNGFLHTGDLGVRRTDGYISLVGRTKEVFKSGGYNVYPREIEQVLENYAGVDMAAVIAVDDPLYNEVGCAFILAGGDELDEEALKAHCREFLANYKIPKKFIIKPELPMLPIGKIDKRALKETIL